MVVRVEGICFITGETVVFTPRQLMCRGMRVTGRLTCVRACVRTCVCVWGGGGGSSRFLGCGLKRQVQEQYLHSLATKPILEHYCTVT